jgi:hypothetical protein
MSLQVAIGHRGVEAIRTVPRLKIGNLNSEHGFLFSNLSISYRKERSNTTC